MTLPATLGAAFLDIVTIEKVAAAGTQELVTVYNWIVDEIKQRGQEAMLIEAAAIQSSVKAADDAVEINEDLKFPRGNG